MSRPSVFRLIGLLCVLLAVQPLLTAHAADAVSASIEMPEHDEHCAPDTVPDLDCDDCAQACAACLIVGASFARPAMAARPALPSALHYLSHGPPAADRDVLYRPPIHV